MKALLTEYSSTSQSANLGLSLEYHAKCKKAFEVGVSFYIFATSFEGGIIFVLFNPTFSEFNAFYYN